MPLMKINNGSYPNDRRAESIYQSFQKAKENFRSIEEDGVEKIAEDAFSTLEEVRARVDDKKPLNVVGAWAAIKAALGEGAMIAATKATIEGMWIGEEVKTVLTQAFSDSVNEGGAAYRVVDAEPAVPAAVKVKSANDKWLVLDILGEGAPEQAGHVDGEIANDAFTALAAVCDRIACRNGRIYTLNAWKPDGRASIAGNGARFRRAAGPDVKCAIDMSSTYASLSNCVFDQDCFLPDGRVDPTKAAVSTIVSSPAANQIVIADASTFRVDMEIFFEGAGRLATESLSGRPREKTNVITGISGNTLTLMYDLDDAVSAGAHVVADFPLLKIGSGAFLEGMYDIAFQRCVTGYRIGEAGPSVGNSSPISLGIRCNNFVGAAIIQRENSAAEQFVGVNIDGSHSLTRTHTGDGVTATFGYYWNVSPRNHFKGRCFTVRLNGGAALVENTDYFVDDVAGTITFAVVPALGVNISIVYIEYAARGFLSIGKGGSVNGMGALSSGQVLGCAVGHEMRGGTGGVEYLAGGIINYDTCSFAGLMIVDSNDVVLGPLKAAFAPYPVILSGCSDIMLAPLYTYVAGSSNYHDLAQVPNRAAITVDSDCVRIRIPRSTWKDKSNGYSVIGRQYVEWGGQGGGPELFEDGTDADNPGMGFRAEPSTGIRRPSTGRMEFMLLGLRALLLTSSAAVLGTGMSLQFANGAMIIPVSGSPEGVVTANKGAMALRIDGTSTAYLKTTDGGNTNWKAITVAA